MKHLEHKIQVSCVQWFRLQYPSLAQLLMSFANGEARTAQAGLRLKREGVVAGAPDLVLFRANGKWHGLCIEMKTSVGRLSESQKVMQQNLTMQGYLYAVCRSFEDFRNTIELYLNSNE